MTKTLYRSREHRVLAGVLGGLAEYTHSDPLLWRLSFVILLIATGFFPFGIAYLVAWMFVPNAPAAATPAPAPVADDASAI